MLALVLKKIKDHGEPSVIVLFNRLGEKKIFSPVPVKYWKLIEIYTKWIIIKIMKIEFDIDSFTNISEKWIKSCKKIFFFSFQRGISISLTKTGLFPIL